MRWGQGISEAELSYRCAELRRAADECLRNPAVAALLVWPAGADEEHSPVQRCLIADLRGGPVPGFTPGTIGAPAPPQHAAGGLLAVLADMCRGGAGGGDAAGRPAAGADEAVAAMTAWAHFVSLLGPAVLHPASLGTALLKARGAPLRLCAIAPLHHANQLEHVCCSLMHERWQCWISTSGPQQREPSRPRRVLHAVWCDMAATQPDLLGQDAWAPGQERGAPARHSDIQPCPGCAAHTTAPQLPACGVWAQVIEGVFLASAWGDCPPVAAFVAWATLCDVFVQEQQLASDKRRALLLNPILHALQAPPLGATPAVRMVPAPAAVQWFRAVWALSSGG